MTASQAHQRWRVDRVMRVAVRSLRVGLPATAAGYYSTPAPEQFLKILENFYGRP